MKISHKNRKIGYTYGSTSGKFMFRNKKIILFESLLEKSFLQVLEFNDMVLDVVEQPFTIETETTKGNCQTKSNISQFKFLYSPKN